MESQAFKGDGFGVFGRLNSSDFPTGFLHNAQKITHTTTDIKQTPKRKSMQGHPTLVLQIDALHPLIQSRYQSRFVFLMAEVFITFIIGTNMLCIGTGIGKEQSTLIAFQHIEYFL